MKPLGQNNSQTPGLQLGSSLGLRKVGLVPSSTVKKTGKVTARADSTGLENKTGLIIEKHHHSVKKEQSASVKRRNARERNRVSGVNNGFGVLKKHVPELKSKCSKVETLRAAISYIKALRELLGQEDIIDSNQNFNFDDEHNGDDSNDFSDISDSPSAFAPATPGLERSPDLTSMNPMVYQLPSSTPIYHSPPTPTSLSPLQLHLSPDIKPLPSLLHQQDIKPLILDRKDQLEKLPSMSITATSWWPECTSTQK